ncbi:MAG: alpha/beta fold hydrolase, partial [Caulobacteraceae bacterium]|nr:alpha/beta fold hydrolase [Caulobacter sp.]
MTAAAAAGRFDLGDLALASGEALPGAFLTWKSYGTLAADRSNAVVFPTSYSAQAADQEWLVAPGGILDPSRWFVVVPDMFGNGSSSSPSNTPDYPATVTAADNVRAQRRLLLEHFGIDRVAAVYGFSMGAGQAYHWAALFPDAVERAIAVCGSAKTATHNKVFLLSLMATLEAAPEHTGGGRFSSEPRANLRAFARVYAGWAMSQDWYRAGLHLRSAADLADFLDREWEPGFTRRRAADLYAQARCWEEADIAGNNRHGGDLSR